MFWEDNSLLSASACKSLYCLVCIQIQNISIKKKTSHFVVMLKGNCTTFQPHVHYLQLKNNVCICENGAVLHFVERNIKLQCSTRWHHQPFQKTDFQTLRFMVTWSNKIPSLWLETHCQFWKSQIFLLLILPCDATEKHLGPSYLCNHRS